MSKHTWRVMMSDNSNSTLLWFWSKILLKNFFFSSLSMWPLVKNVLASLIIFSCRRCKVTLHSFTKYTKRATLTVWWIFVSEFPQRILRSTVEFGNLYSNYFSHLYVYNSSNPNFAPTNNIYTCSGFVIHSLIKYPSPSTEHKNASSSITPI